MEKQLILASHGSLAEGMHSAINMIIGEDNTVQSFGLDKYENPDIIAQKIEKIMIENPEINYIIVTDIKGGSVYNHLLPLCKHPQVFVLTGMNLALCLETQLLTGSSDLQKQLAVIVESSRAGIELFSLSRLEAESGMEDDNLW